jgi:HPt (histidine-containing phosphotransfer) domain-containing protein
VSKVFDSDSLVRRMMDSTELASRVAATFLADMPRQMSALARALDCADAKSVRMAAHSIKGAAAIVGGNQLRSVAADMERLAANGDVGSAALLLTEIGTLADRLKVEIEKFCETAR